MPLAPARVRTVLCVDDNRALNDNLREVLEDAGYAVRQAETCADALVRAREGFDFALVDVRLPDGDGTTLAIQLRELHPDAEIIMLTGFATVESAVAAVRAGAWAYLMKPCAMNELLVTLEQANRQLTHVEEKRALETRARFAEKLAAIGTLTAGLSHEIKNPLNAASLQLVLLERRIRKLSAETQTGLVEPLQLVKDEISRLNDLLEEFLHFARPQELHRRTLDPVALLERVIALLAPQAAARGVRLEPRWEHVPEIAADEARLRQAVVNLALNAIQAARGVVRIAADRVGDWLEISVEDDGPGVPPEVAARVFEPFFTTKESGSGLGLPLVHGIVEHHGGTITLARSSLGGARFIVRLPIHLA